jgi:hypothetical protein
VREPATGGELLPDLSDGPTDLEAPSVQTGSTSLTILFHAGLVLAGRLNRIPATQGAIIGLMACIPEDVETDEPL